MASGNTGIYVHACLKGLDCLLILPNGLRTPYARL